MKVLFICSGNSSKGVSPIVKNQGDSLLEAKDIDLDFYLIKGKGFFSYFRYIFKLKTDLNKKHYDVIHAHYSLSGFVASLAGLKHIVVSLMGSDVHSNYLSIVLIRIFSKMFSWGKVIVKSEKMGKVLRVKNAVVIPNGVNLHIFKPMNKVVCQKKIGWKEGKKHILFASNPERREKNYDLVQRSLEIISNSNIEVHLLVGVPNNYTPIWYNASDLVVLSSLWEGSPNAVKEAMACDRPLVCTDVGDVRWLFSGCKGCFISSYSAEDYANKINEAINLDRSDGRSKIIELGLDSKEVANAISKVYKSVISNYA